ncbi:MAG: YggS family pyridoxal phosphate-dependent enzyme [Elusimicrobiota bacterium]
MLKENYLFIQQKIEKAAHKSGRKLSDITLVVVTKTIPAELIQQALDCGVIHLGENKVQEAHQKRPFLEKFKATHHLIGHLQTNKAKKAVQLFDLIQSVDSFKCAEVLNRVAKDANKRQRCLIEVKTSDEENKTGLARSEVDQLISEFTRYDNLVLEGLMTIPPLSLEGEKLRNHFKEFKKFFDDKKNAFRENPILSMGMSNDFEVAIEEGATMVRLGRAFFGERLK